MRRHLGCLYGNNAIQADALLIHLVQYGQCHMEFEYTEQEVYMVVIPGMSPLSVHTAIPTVAFLPLRRLSIRFSSSDICARTTVAIQVNKGKYGDEICFHNFNFFKEAIRTQDTTFSSKLLK